MLDMGDKKKEHKFSKNKEHANTRTRNLYPSDNKKMSDALLAAISKSGAATACLISGHRKYVATAHLLCPLVGPYSHLYLYLYTISLF